VDVEASYDDDDDDDVGLGDAASAEMAALMGMQGFGAAKISQGKERREKERVSKKRSANQNGSGSNKKAAVTSSSGGVDAAHGTDDRLDVLNKLQLKCESNCNTYWEMLVKKFGQYQFSWSEYAAWGRSHCPLRTSQICMVRGVYRRALGKVTDFPDSVRADWVQFEREFGTLEDLFEAEKKIKSGLPQSGHAGNQGKAAGQPSLKQMNGNSKAPESTNTHPGARGGTGKSDNDSEGPKSAQMKTEKEPLVKDTISGCKRGANALTMDSSDKDQHTGRSTAAIAAIEQSGVDSNVAKKLKTENGTLSNGTQSVDASVKSEEPSGDSADVDSNQRRDTIYVNFLPKSYTEENVRTTFSAFGKIRDMRVFMDKGGAKLRYVLIQYAEETAVDAALKLHKSIPKGGNQPMAVLRSRNPITHTQSRTDGGKNTSKSSECADDVSKFTDKKEDGSAAASTSKPNPYLSSGLSKGTQKQKYRMGMSAESSEPVGKSSVKPTKSVLAFKPRKLR
jgi:hypothetical protein